jgi:hypothetical protein
MRGAVLKILAGSALAVVACAATPAAASVTFNTVGSTLSCNGVVNCTGGGSSVAYNGLTLTYFANLSSTIDPTSNINLGALQALGTGPFDLTGLLFTIMINQTVPGGSGSLPAGTLSGIISQTASGATISWVTPSVTINGYMYTVTNNPLSLVPPNSCVAGACGLTTIQGSVAAVPEPATWGLMLLGFGGIGMAMRRRRRPALAQVA